MSPVALAAALALAVAQAPAAPAPQPPPPPPVAVPAPAAATRVVTLEDAVSLARRNLPAVRQSRATAAAAQARADQARAGLLPQLAGTASFERANGSTSGTSFPGLYSGAESSWRANLSASQLLWDFGQTSSRWGAAKQSAQADVEGAHSTEQQAVLAVRTAYFQARAAKDLVGVARATLGNQQAHLEQIAGFVKLGTRPPIDLAQARTNVANAQVQLVNAENGYDTARARLNQAMGVEGPIDYDVASEGLPPVSGEDGTAEALVDEALRSRPDLASATTRVAAAERSVSAARGAYGPTVSLDGAYGWLGRPSPTDPGQFWPQSDSRAWSFGATLSWPIFTGGLTQAQVTEARANVDVASAAEDQVRQQVRVDVVQAFLSVRAARTALVAAADAVTNAREQLRLAEGRYTAGAGSALELSDAQVAATNAAAQQVQAQYNLATARAQLLQAIGRT